jgi:hypothetical protein
MSLTSHPLFIVGVTIAAFIVVLVTGRMWSRWQVRRWCDDQGYDLVDWRGAKFFEGPGAWLRSENQDAYRIEVRDRQGTPRAGYVVFGSYWAPWSRKVRVEWDEP